MIMRERQSKIFRGKREGQITGVKRVHIGRADETSAPIQLGVI